MRILALIPESNRRSPARIYRGEGWLERLPHYGKVDAEYGERSMPVEVDYWDESFYRKDWHELIRVARAYDWLYVMRSAEPQHAQIVSKLVSFGLKLWFDLDDDYTGIEPDNTAYPAFQRPDVQEAFRWFLQNADLRTNSTKHLADKFGGHVVPNALDDFTYDLDRPYPNPTKGLITWRGGGSHLQDLQHFAPEFEQAIQDNPDLTFQFIGFRPWWLMKYGNVLATDYIQDYWIYMSHLIQLKPWANVLPLHDCAFNRGKSNIGALESVYAGAVPIVPDWPEWNEMPATLRYHTKGELPSLIALVKSMSPEEHKERWEANMKWIRENRVLSVTNEQRLRLLTDGKA